MSMIGKTLAHYEITSKLGKGGMGEVFRAKDQKLGREVAIKVLPEEFARDADRVARFQREAKLLASLNHPNIAAIHGLEESDGIQFLVLELIEGDTLADRIKAGPIPVEEALKLALQIAEALEAAHERGVIHRDLKPANIKVTPDGKAKVLDFGLAKAFAVRQQDETLSYSPTLSEIATQHGVILGTAAYMSPEQAKGKTVDKRADIWAFGCVLYEMLTGRQLFKGETVSETLAAVLKSQPEWNNLPLNLHPRTRLMLERCLEKESKDRSHDIADVRVDIQKVLTGSSGVLAQPVTAIEPRTKLQTILLWIAAAIVLTAIITGVAVWKLRPSEPRQVMRFDYDLPESQQFGDLSGAQAVAVSPDGNLLTYSTPEGLYLRSMSDRTAKLLAGTEGASNPFFSPDGQWIGYVSTTDRKLKKTAIGGNAPVTLCDAGVDGGFSWTSDNRIIQGSGENIWWVSANGGKLEPLFVEKGKLLGAPQMLPDGKSVLFTADIDPPHRIMVRSLRTGEGKVLLEGGFARYIKSGHIVYGVGNNLYAVPFDPDTLEVTGGPVLLVESVLSNGQWRWHYDVSDSGTLVYIPGTTTSTDKRTLLWVDRHGKEEPIAVAPADYRSLKISPDGAQLALSIAAGGNQDIHIWDIARENMRQLTLDNSDDAQPLWSADGKSIVFTCRQTDVLAVCRKEADGTGELKTFNPLDKSVMPWSWSSDGKTLLLMVWSGTNFDISALSMEGDPAIKPLLHDTYNEVQPRISPNGRWMAYASDESGQNEVYVCPFPEVNKGRWKVSINGGTNPLWSRDGRELFYWTDNALMVVPVEAAPTFIHRTAKVQFQRTPIYTVFFGAKVIPWDISPDGKRCLMMKLSGATPLSAAFPRKINIVLNWFEELKQRIPVK